MESSAYYNETFNTNDENRHVQQSDVDSDNILTLKKIDYTRMTRASKNIVNLIKLRNK